MARRDKKHKGVRVEGVRLKEVLREAGKNSSIKNLTMGERIMSTEKKVEEAGEYSTPTCAGWLKRVDGKLEDLRKSPYELEDVRKLSDVEEHLAAAVEYLREAVMSLAMEVAHLKLVATGGKGLTKRKKG